MSRRPLHTNGDDSAERESSESRSSFDFSIEDPESQVLYPLGQSRERHASAFINLQSLLSRRGLDVCCSNFLKSRKTRRRGDRKAWCKIPASRRLCFLFQTLLAITVLLVAFIAIARPSYSSPPARYHELRLRAKTSTEASRANPTNEKVFIAASIFDRYGDLARGAWGKAILNLVDLLGPSNVFLSIYENDAGPVAKAALKELEEKVTCEHTIIFEDQIDVDSVPHILLPDGTIRVKRIAYLAEVRNRALHPLTSSSTKYDKLLYLNDIIFDPIGAAQLLFATNAGSGKAEYRAACSMDFINPFKFYDTFASRDLEGYSMGLPIHPWFSSAGKAQSRQDVFDQKDAVRVRSCWGGLVAFDATFFQSTPAEVDDLDTAGRIDDANFTGFRFRAEEDVFWEAAECCLIHADIQKPEENDTGIYMNPYIRVAYDTTTLSWLGLSRRIERLYTPFQYVINTVVGLPWYNPRRAEQPWQEVQERVWSPNASLSEGGSFKLVDRIATHAGFCGMRTLQVLKENPQPGEKNWESIPVPPR
jgi:Cryptococcal mannosyltransferase 1